MGCEGRALKPRDRQEEDLAAVALVLRGGVGGGWNGLAEEGWWA